MQNHRIGAAATKKGSFSYSTLLFSQLYRRKLQGFTELCKKWEWSRECRGGYLGLSRITVFENSSKRLILQHQRADLAFQIKIIWPELSKDRIWFLTEILSETFLEFLNNVEQDILFSMHNFSKEGQSSINWFSSIVKIWSFFYIQRRGGNIMHKNVGSKTTTLIVGVTSILSTHEWMVCIF